MSETMKDTLGWIMIIGSITVLSGWLSFAVVHDYKAGLLPSVDVVLGECR